MEKSHEFVKGMKEVRIDDVGHWILLQAKDVVVEEVLRFLGESLRSVNSKL